jgi:hypothetical protein
MEEKERKVVNTTLMALMSILLDKGVFTEEELNQKFMEANEEVERAYHEHREVI